MLPFPKDHELMRPMLETVADGEPHALKQVVARMQAQSGLSSEQLAETIPSGQPKFRNRSLWAATYLRKAQALSTPKRGWVQLAERGRQLLSEPGPVTVARLQEFPGWHEAWGTAARDESSPPEPQNEPRRRNPPRKSRSPMASSNWKRTCVVNCSNG
jgi:restriction system protein